MSFTPVAVTWREGRPVVHGCDFGDLAFTDPFFSDTYRRLRQREPDLALVATGIEALREGEAGLPPSGFIFHMSRCGSTLVSRLLATCPRILVLGEPDALNGLFNSPEGACERTVAEGFRELVLALGRRRRPSEEAYVVKLTSFLIHHLPLVRRAFPETPWLFLHRDPGEVMVSVLDRPTGYLAVKARPECAARWLPVPPGEIAAMSDEEYVARFLGGMCEAALAAAERPAAGQLLLLDYRELPGAIWTGVARLFGIALTPGEEARMAAMASTYSKDASGRRRFQGDSAEKARRITPRMRAALERWAAGPYRRLGGR